LYKQIPAQVVGFEADHLNSFLVACYVEHGELIVNKHTVDDRGPGGIGCSIWNIRPNLFENVNMIASPCGLSGCLVLIHVRVGQVTLSVTPDST